MPKVLYHRTEFCGARISPAAGATKNVEFLFVCLSVTLLNDRVCVHDFAMKALNTETVLIPLDRGRFLNSCAHFFNFLRMPPICATTRYAEIPKMAKFWLFRRSLILHRGLCPLDPHWGSAPRPYMGSRSRARHNRGSSPTNVISWHRPFVSHALERQSLCAQFCQ